MVCGLVEPEAWTLPSPRKLSGLQKRSEQHQPALCQPQTEEVLREDRFSSPKRNFRTSTGRRWQRECFALRAEIEASREMIACRFSGERTDFASLQSKASRLLHDLVVARESTMPHKESTVSPAAAEESVFSARTARMHEPNENGSSPPRRRSPSPDVGLLSARGLPQAHASLNSGDGMNRFCGLCGLWYNLGDGPHRCSQCNLEDPLSESMQEINGAHVEMQLQERMMHFERIHHVQPSKVEYLPATPEGEIARMNFCNYSKQGIKSPEKPDLGENTVPENAAYDHTRARGDEMRNFGSEIDELAADLFALEGEIIAL